jgi:hypothetical protein
VGWEPLSKSVRKDVSRSSSITFHVSASVPLLSSDRRARRQSRTPSGTAIAIDTDASDNTTMAKRGSCDVKTFGTKDGGKTVSAKADSHR